MRPKSGRRAVCGELPSVPPTHRKVQTPTKELAERMSTDTATSSASAGSFKQFLLHQLTALEGCVQACAPPTGDTSHGQRFEPSASTTTSVLLADEDETYDPSRSLDARMSEWSSATQVNGIAVDKRPTKKISRSMVSDELMEDALLATGAVAKARATDSSEDSLSFDSAHKGNSRPKRA